MQLPSLRRVVALALSSTILVASLPAYAQPAGGAPGEDAGSHFEAGVKFFKDGDYTAAMVEFKKAYELDPNWFVLYNIGQTARELRSYTEALNALERYLKEGGDQVPADRRTNVVNWIAELKTKTAQVTITCNIEGADIAVDDVGVGLSPLKEAVVMDAGKRKITATKEGYVAFSRVIEVAGLEQKKLEIELVSLVGKTTVIPDVEHTPWPWVGLSFTGVLGISTAVVGGLSFGKKSDFDTAIATVPGNKQTIDEARDVAKTYALAADALGGITAAFGVLTIIAFAVDYSRSPEIPAEGGEPGKEGQPPPPAPVSVIPLISPTYVGVMGTFF